jgi:FG-GAP-like repeat
MRCACLGVAIISGIAIGLATTPVLAGSRSGTWRYVRITSRHEQTFGLTFADVDRDGMLDVVSGGYWYRNAGGDIGASPWRQGRLPEGMHAIATLDVDGDDHADLVAQRDDGGNSLGIYWLEQVGASNESWTTSEIGTVPRASHGLGAQGVAIAALRPGDRPGVWVSSGGGIYSFGLPPDPRPGALWPGALVSKRPSDEGFAVVDVDGDGLRDVVATTGDTKHVEWYRAPDWGVVSIAEFTSAVYPDRVGAADLNGDGRIDVIVTEENGVASGADTIWWEQPASPDGRWTPHKLVTQATTNSMDVVDMDDDGDVDIVLAEHRGAKRLETWHNNGTGRFDQEIVSRGRENHLGGKAVDLDGDNDLDLVGIGYDNPAIVHLWINPRLS